MDEAWALLAQKTFDKSGPKRFEGLRLTFMMRCDLHPVASPCRLFEAEQPENFESSAARMSILPDGLPFSGEQQA